MDFIAVYIGHRCTLWLYKFTLRKYFSRSESVSPKECCWKSLLIVSALPSAFICRPGSERHLLHALAPLPGTLLASCCEASGGIWGHSWSWSSYRLRLPGAPGPQVRYFLSIPALLSKAASLCLYHDECGQETVFWLPPGGSRAVLVWCRLRSPRGPSTLVELCLAVQVNGFCFYPSPSSPRRERLTVLALVA